MIVDAKTPVTDATDSDHPPAYTEPQTQTPSRPVPDIQPCNHLVITRRDAQSGQYLLDPELEIPDELLAPISDNDTRKNLSISSDHAVDVEIWIVARQRQLVDVTSPSRLVTIDLQGESVKAKIYADAATKFALNIHGHEGGVTLEIPRTFTGPLTLEAESTFSEDVARSVATFSDVERVRKCFVGDFASSGFSAAAWEGGSITIKARDKARLRFNDEETSADSPRRGLWPFSSSSSFFTRSSAPSGGSSFFSSPAGPSFFSSHLPDLPANVNVGLTSSNLPGLPNLPPNLPNMPTHIGVTSSNLPDLPNIPNIPANLPNMPNIPPNIPNIPNIPANLPDLPNIPQMLANVFSGRRSSTPPQAGSPPGPPPPSAVEEGDAHAPWKD